MAWGQIVFKENADFKADYLVFEVDREYKADLLVYMVDREYKAKGNEGLWFFTNGDFKANFSVFFVDRNYKADFTVFFCGPGLQSTVEKQNKNACTQSSGFGLSQT